MIYYVLSGEDGFVIKEQQSIDQRFYFKIIKDFGVKRNRRVSFLGVEKYF